MESSTDYDLFFVVELGGLQYRKYIVQFPQSHCDTGSACGATHVARVVKFKQKNVSQRRRTGRKLLPVLNECYKLMFDQETNLLHSITDRQVLLQCVPCVQISTVLFNGTFKIEFWTLPIHCRCKKMRVRVQQDFWEYEANGDIHSGPISDNYIFTANGSAIPAYKSVAMEIVPGKIVSEIRQYFYRWKKRCSLMSLIYYVCFSGSCSP